MKAKPMLATVLIPDGWRKLAVYEVVKRGDRYFGCGILWRKAENYGDTFDHPDSIFIRKLNAKGRKKK